MSYQVLARKWRPQTFADVVGQQHVLTALANGLTLGRIHHAYLFSGTRGVGKTTLARLLAKGLNCVNGVTATPCGQCENCLEIEQGRFVDLIEIDAASRTKVEDTRELLDNVQYAPARGRFKVYLIDEVHMLSRHSFNALLKTLEEPPEHVKFLLATTDPQKLPVTILSRCLQFHLTVLDVEQIRQQLERVLQAEQITSETRALQLLARAADGSMRDALSLTDQAIAIGQGSVTTATVSQMLGTLDNEQPLAILEALVNAQGEALMNQVEQAASRGVDWENLLVEMLTLLHRVAMLQLMPTLTDNHYLAIEHRLRELARTLPPAELQLYYQTLLMGRRDLPDAPDRRMGIEMTLLRALVFQPQSLMAEPAAPVLIAPVQAPVSVTPEPSTALPYTPATVAAVNTDAAPPATPVSAALPDATAQLLQARTQLLRQQGGTSTKKGEPAAPERARPVSTALERFASVAERKPPHQAKETKPHSAAATPKPEAYRWRSQTVTPEPVTPVLNTPKALRSALEHEKTPELAVKLATEAVERDPWAADVEHLPVPKLVQQMALNAFKEVVAEDKICLHLRSAQRHLNSSSAQSLLAAALSELYNRAIELTVVEDDSPAQRTPLEWRQAIYEEKLAQARQSITADSYIQTLCRYFDAQLDEESIRPV